MPILLPDIPEPERTPLIQQLLDIIALQQDRIQQLEERIQQLQDEIARLKGLKARPRIAPSTLESPTRPPRDPNAKRPGSAKRSKTAQLTITEDIVVRLDDHPDEAVFKGYEDFVVQDLILKPRVIRYRRERWLTPDGTSLVAPLPADVLPGSHYGPDLICYILHQYHHQHVTQPLLLEQLHQVGIDISAGELNRILTENNAAFHQEKAELLPAALAVSDYVEVDDTGARHQGHNGACTQIGNEFFASFASTASKSRLNFLELLRQPHTDYVINETATAYWQRQKLPQAVMDSLRRGPQAFADPAAWQARLRALGITGERHVRIASEGALLGSLIAHGVSPELVILSDGAGQYDVLVHAACWIHAERPLARLIPYSEEHRAAIAQVRGADLGTVPGSESLSAATGAVTTRGSRSPVRRVVWAADRLPQHRRRPQGDAGAPCGVVACARAPRSPVAHQPERRPPSGLREEAEDQRQHAERVGPSGAGHVRQPEEDVPGVGSELLGLSPGPGARRGPNAPLGGSDPPQGGGDSGQEGRCRAAGVGGWRRGGVNAKAMVPQDFRAIPAPRPDAPRLPTVIEKLQKQPRFVKWLSRKELEKVD